MFTIKINNLLLLDIKLNHWNFLFISNKIIFIQGRIKPKVDVNKFLNFILISQKTVAYDETSFFKNLFIYLFIWLRWVFIVALGLSLVAASRGCSSLRCVGFSLQWLLLLRSTGSRHTGFSSCGSQALEHRLSSCGARA